MLELEVFQLLLLASHDQLLAEVGTYLPGELLYLSLTLIELLILLPHQTIHTINLLLRCRQELIMVQLQSLILVDLNLQLRLYGEWRFDLPIHTLQLPKQLINLLISVYHNRFHLHNPLRPHTEFLLKLLISLKINLIYHHRLLLLYLRLLILMLILNFIVILLLQLQSTLQRGHLNLYLLI